MPFYKFVGNKILTYCQNRLLRASLSEFHSGYRLYAVSALRQIPFHLNSNVFHFDTEIIIQLLIAKQRIQELPIPTYYGDEICHVDGVRYGWDVLKASATARIQELSLFYDRKFDCAPKSRENDHYLPKLSYDSTHKLALDRIPAGSRVLDLGCAGGYMGAELRAKGCYVAGVDMFPLGEGIELDEFHFHDLNEPGLPVDLSQFDYVLLLDVIEHLRSPEAFVERLRAAAALAPHVQFIVSTGNVGFIVTRLMLLVGQLNYGKRGILDLTHTRLFTFRAFRRLFEQEGFDILEERGVAAPFAFALGSGAAARALIAVNAALIRLRRTLFSYQSFLVVRARPSLEVLLQRAETSSRGRAEEHTAQHELTGSLQG
jgi:2-polyprenyl-3-methyl-5-hydroxy-6-metoxy-1,4-benzoquinol methylase